MCGQPSASAKLLLQHARGVFHFYKRMWSENRASIWAAEGNSPQAEGAAPALPGQQTVTALPCWLSCSGFPEQCNSLCAMGWTHSAALAACHRHSFHKEGTLLLIQALISQRSPIPQSYGRLCGVPPARVKGMGWGSLGFGWAVTHSWEMGSAPAPR